MYALVAIVLLLEVPGMAGLIIKDKKNQEFGTPKYTENPALDGWTQLDGSLARKVHDHIIDVDLFESSHKNVECADATNNILPREKGGAHYPLRRDYSVIRSTSTVAQNQKDCTSVPELLHAVKYGNRTWEGGLVDPMKPSVFVAAGCNVPQWKPADVKTTLAKMEFISLDGDSLTRHMAQGLSLIASDNYYDGAVAHGGGWEKCTCDGQFSGALTCRALADTSQYEFPQKQCGSDGSPRMYWLQGGPHFHSSAKKTLKAFFWPKIKEIQALHSQCSTAPTIFVTGLNAQSRDLDHKYKHQSREKAEIFNQELEKAFAEEKQVHIVDFLNMTRDAMSSDGFHYMTDVNIVKAKVFVTLLDLIQKPY